jgi:hypothetical protein
MGYQGWCTKISTARTTPCAIGGAGWVRMGYRVPTVWQIGVVEHLLNRETRFSAEIWCKKNQKR